MVEPDPTVRVNVSAYLERIGCRGPLTPDAETLRALHLAHMLAVPFENLDIALGRAIICDESRFLHKIIHERRGGFCYELNGAFAALLRDIGYNVTLLSARVANEQGVFGADFDHLALRVDMNEMWLADVGFGDSFVEPLRMAPNIEQEQFGRTYRLVPAQNGFCYEMKSDHAWKKQYSFTLQPRRLSDFAAMCRYNQTSPESSFTRKRICSLATTHGRITLSNSKFIETRDGVREERDLTEAEFTDYLKRSFGMVLPRTSPGQ